MPIRFSAFGRQFSASLPMTLLTIVLLALFFSLGNWQWNRGADKRVLWDRFERAAAPVYSARAPDVDALPRYSRIAFSGRYRPERQFLLDNRINNGRPGYEVLTPATTSDGRWVLINRGWIPFSGYRDRLPDVSMHGAGTATISGYVDELPSAGLASGRAAPAASVPGENWPKLTSYPTHAELEAALGEKLARRIVLLDRGVTGYGDYVRSWSPGGLSPDRHFSYAIQWWGFALVLLVLYFGLNFRKVP
jgi:cytochrome oxidase assembly protein ShyY1